DPSGGSNRRSTIPIALTYIDVAWLVGVASYEASSCRQREEPAMGRPSSGGVGQPKLRKGLWSPEEDEKLYNHILRYGVGCWSSVPRLAGLHRCGKSCRLRGRVGEPGLRGELKQQQQLELRRRGGQRARRRGAALGQGGDGAAARRAVGAQVLVTLPRTEPRKFRVQFGTIFLIFSFFLFYLKNISLLSPSFLRETLVPLSGTNSRFIIL
uniref:Uncharacterized protein n=1 Tax=Aegilops tauschii subsp. strangulata TaxID=200361 RepID=A0A452ZQR9_AEGTS